LGPERPARSHPGRRPTLWGLTRGRKNILVPLVFSLSWQHLRHLCPDLLHEITGDVHWSLWINIRHGEAKPSFNIDNKQETEGLYQLAGEMRLAYDDLRLTSRLILGTVVLD
jgi:hypothetical protein